MSIISAILRRKRPNPGRVTQATTLSALEANKTPDPIKRDCVTPPDDKDASTSFSNEQCALATVAIIRAISSNLHLSDEAEYNEEKREIDMVSLSLKETPECAPYSEALLDYTLRAHISPVFLLTVCNRPVAVHESKPATILF